MVMPMGSSPSSSPEASPDGHAFVPRRLLLEAMALVGAALAVPALGACGSVGGSGDVAMSTVPRTAASPEARPDGIRVISSFTGAFFAAVTDEPGNVVCSPYSIVLALAMTRNGARGGTAAEMDTIFGATSLVSLDAGLNAVSQVLTSRAGPKKRADGVESEVALEVASTIFGQVDTTWLQPFLDRLAASFGAGVQLVDYKAATEAARARINDWTKGQTDGAIEEILPRGVLGGLTRMVLVNAVHLKAPWAKPFDKQGTQRAPFHPASGNTVQADMMGIRVEGADVAQGAGWTAARLRYAGGQLAMALVLPDEGREADLVRQLGSSGTGPILSSFEPHAQLDLTMPKFEFDYGRALKELLSRMGMPTAFSDNADFGGMTTDEPLQVTQVLHHARISVDEEGTEASAATAVVMGTTAAPAPSQRVKLVLDRPFLFLIHDVETATPLFIGRVGDPTAKA